MKTITVGKHTLRARHGNRVYTVESLQFVVKGLVDSHPLEFYVRGSLYLISLGEGYRLCLLIEVMTSSLLAHKASSPSTSKKLEGKNHLRRY